MKIQFNGKEYPLEPDDKDRIDLMPLWDFFDFGARKHPISWNDNVNEALFIERVPVEIVHEYNPYEKTEVWIPLGFLYEYAMTVTPDFYLAVTIALGGARPCVDAKAHLLLYDK